MQGVNAERIGALKAIVEDIPRPFTIADVPLYAELLLELLASPKAVLFSNEEKLFVFTAIQTLAKERCSVLSDAFEAFAATEEVPSL